ncbi:MAG: hypothetical protein HYR63_02605 [Proteobacteria bacterium]|nr:hypothetical protein [Pseudomonadota bacterium]MBI3496474.1 hypothetical protein [Pseudomonadota bacterium]
MVGVLDQVKRFFAPEVGGANRRQAPRVDTPPECAVFFDGKRFPLKNWSTLGFLAGPYDGDLIAKQRCKLKIHVRQETFDIAFDAEAIIVRTDASGIAGRFIFLPPDKKRQIEGYFAHFAASPR